MALPPSGFRIRDLDKSSMDEIELVASRMRLTLIDVLGEERGGSMYSAEWLRNRLLWHLDPQSTTARVLLAEGEKGPIAGHAIGRMEREGENDAYGYFSTLYVEPGARGGGIGSQLVEAMMDWFAEIGMPKVVYNTASSNLRLIRLFERQGFVITLAEGEMVQLSRAL
jgi:ribosomal protein S18 acetylase RimI-like enzyme